MGKAAFAKLIYTEDAWPLFRCRELTIIAEGRRVVCAGKDGRIEHRCGEAEWRKLEALLSACNFPAWRKEYRRQSWDGQSWHLEIHAADGHVRKSDGINAYPAEWPTFTAMCDYCEEIARPGADEKP